MRNHIELPSLDSLKDQAKRLRASLSQEGQTISHSRALELVAVQFGYRDWNTLHAAVGNRPPFNPYMLGSRVSGFYLGQPFTGSVLGVQSLGGDPERYRLTLHFDDPVDVVTFDSFSAFRQRVHCNVDTTGRTAQKTSNGRPQVELVW
ncbi:glyoxalase superfamily protein [Agrobacterium sp. BA1120]|uniref:glyoxalase superfamily protein n=1 Tax=Agrobacterium sp. BA1120 TaxID=3228927 RepID=UPI003369E6FD